MRAYVLAGGASSRMGSDKARLPGGPALDRPCAVVLAEVLEEAGCEATLVRRGSPDGLPWPRSDGGALTVLRESDAGPRHPLNGVVTALEDAAGPALIVPCDVLGLTVEHVRSLLECPAVAEVGGRLHPLIAHLPPTLLEPARRLVAAGGSARKLVRDLPRRPLEGLVDRNRPDPTRNLWPLDRLLARLSWTSESDRDRIARGECVRQRARGVVDPSASRYAREPQRREHG